jgi:nicotinate-nucleotide adenylyltransferase
MISMKTQYFNILFNTIVSVICFQSCSSVNHEDQISSQRVLAQNTINHLQNNSCNNIAESIFNSKDSDHQSFLYDNILKIKHLKKDIVVPTDDLNELKILKIQTYFENISLFEESSFQDRYNLLKNFSISDISAAPGHRFVRKPEQINGLVKYIENNPYAHFNGDKIILNVISGRYGKIESVDLWNAHHRLVAYLENGYVKISDIPQNNIEILVNGKTQYGEHWVHYLPAAGVDWKNIEHYSNVPAGGEIREGTISVSGKISNYHLGARNTLGQLHKNVFNQTRLKMKVGVYFGTFDPIHEGHIGIIKKAMDVMGLDEVLIVPNINPIHKRPTPIKNRNEMIILRIEKEDKINLYTGNSDEIVDKFGRNPFFERMIQIYGSTNLYQIIGDDSFDNLLKEGEIERSLFRKYIVFPRKGSNLQSMRHENVIFVDYEDKLGLSSTALKQKIKNNETPKESEIAPVEYDYIIKNHLYKN